MPTRDVVLTGTFTGTMTWEEDGTTPPVDPPPVIEPPPVQPPPGGTTVFVATTGNDSNPGTIDKPWRTINYAHSKLSVGKALNIRGGVYQESLDMTNGWPGGQQADNWKDAIGIRAHPGEPVTVKPPPGANYCAYMRGPSAGATNAPRYLIYDHILFDGANIASVGFYVSSYDSMVNPAQAPSHHIRVQYCRITNIGHSQGFAAMWGSVGCEFLFGEVDHVNGPSHNNDNTQGFYVAASDFKLIGSHIHDMWGYGISNLSSMPGFDVDDHLIQGNRVHDCGQGGKGLGGINLGEGTGHRIFTNLSYRNAGPGINLRFNPGPGSDGLIIDGNSVKDNQGEGIYVSGMQVRTVVRNNIGHGNGGGDYVNLGQGTVADHNLFGVDPQLVDAANGDFHLKKTSPARGKGVGSLAIPKDFYGTNRPTSGACDIGAAQYV